MPCPATPLDARCRSSYTPPSSPARPPFLIAGTPLWKLVLKQFDDTLVKVRPDRNGLHTD
jgi:hypothetical protein